MRRRISSKSRTCTEGAHVDAAGISAKVGAHYPGRSARRVNHDILMSRVALKVRDKRVLKLIGRYLAMNKTFDS